MKRSIAALAQTTVWLQDAGFDAAELHFAGIYLINAFLNPNLNTRTDEYGGSVENRARFAFEALEAVRKAVGRDFPLIAKINSNAPSFREDGPQGETKYIAQGFADRGLDAVEVSGVPTLPDILSKEDQNYYARTARNIAKISDIPLILAGGVRNVEMMEEALKYNDKIVAFGMARALMREPDLPLKWQKDTNYDPLCISCNWCLDHCWDDGGTVKTHCQFVPDRV
jgi:2,4-dienoyl-CoA reductase-like NADH-dependent reductase (Old Yellow Enzyme family)